MTEQPATDVIGALRAVMADLPAIGKGGRGPGDQGGYAFRKAEDIAIAVNPLLPRHGVLFVPHVIDCTVTPCVVAGKNWTDTRLTVTYTVYGPGGIEDHIEVGPVVGIGRDGSDKGSNKAMTQAFKYALTQTFCIAEDHADVDYDSFQADTAPTRTVDLGELTHDEVRTLNDAVKNLPPAVREEFVAWKDSKKFPYPWPRTAYDEMTARLADMVLEHNAEQNGSAGAEQPQPVAAAPGGGTTPADAQAAPEGAVRTAREQAARDQLAAVAWRDACEAQVKSMRVPDVRAELRLAKQPDDGTGPEARDRYVEYLVAQGPPAAEPV